MSAPRVLVLRSPGTNCDVETAYAFAQAGGQAEPVHINQLLAEPARIQQFQILCLPGGFSYGDDLGAGRILAAKIRHHLAELLARFVDQGKLVLGICNGFQVLMQSGLLQGTDNPGPWASLTWNHHGRYEARWVHLRVAGQRCPMLAGIERLELPVAHAEGRFLAPDPQLLEQLDARGQLVLRYDMPAGVADADPLPFPYNPNGSQRNVAGLCDPSGRVLGLMPHPERFLHRTQHPRWTRERLETAVLGLRIFENAVRFFR